MRSDAGGDLNEFNTYFGNQKHPVLRPDEYGMQPYDVPNRLLFWGEFAGAQFGTFYNGAGRSVRLKFEFVKY